jgi:hypothetical protein
VSKIRRRAKKLGSGLEAHVRYYQLASQLTHTFPFFTEIDRKVWELHCKGLYYSEIAGRLRIPERRVKQLVKYIASHINFSDE